MFMWMKLEGGVKDADDIIDALKDEQVAVVPGQHHTHTERQTLKPLAPLLPHTLAHALFHICKCNEVLTFCRCQEAPLTVAAWSNVT